MQPDQPAQIPDQSGSPQKTPDAPPVQFGTPVVPVQPTTPPTTPLAQPAVSTLPPLPMRVAPTEQPAQPAQVVTPVVATTPVNRVVQIRRVVYTALSILEIFLAIRLLLRLFAANPDAIFSELIYTLTFPFITPFLGVFPDTQASGSVLELSTVLAMIMYPIFAWIILRIVRLSNRRQPTANP